MNVRMILMSIWHISVRSSECVIFQPYNYAFFEKKFKITPFFHNSELLSLKTGEIMQKYEEAGNPGIRYWPLKLEIFAIGALRWKDRALCTNFKYPGLSGFFKIRSQRWYLWYCKTFIYAKEEIGVPPLVDKVTKGKDRVNNSYFVAFTSHGPFQVACALLLPCMEMSFRWCTNDDAPLDHP